MEYMNDGESSTSTGKIIKIVVTRLEDCSIAEALVIQEVVRMSTEMRISHIIMQMGLLSVD